MTMRINLDKEVGAFIAVAVAPFQKLITRLVDEGRISQAELDTLHGELEQLRGSNLLRLLQDEFTQPPVREGREQT